MSWLARSLANSMATPPPPPPPPDPRENQQPNQPSPSSPPSKGEESADDPELHGRGVKEDLSELTETLSRQFWGVASFLAPPAPSSTDRLEPSTAGEESDEGIRGDFAEIGGRFRSGIGRIASNLLPPFGSEDDLGDYDHDNDEEVEEEEEEEEVVGVTEEVMAFARNIAMHPETWLDFPLFPEFEDTNDFEMSYIQQEHAFAVESLAPRLAALRIELCPTHMTEGCFWKIYFVLLHSRLNKHDAELLSTPQIAEARAMLLRKLQDRNKAEREAYRSSGFSTVSPREQVKSPPILLRETSSSNASQFEEASTLMPATDLETEKHTVDTTEVKIVDKSVINEEPSVHRPFQYDDDDGDDWLEDDASDDMGISRSTTIPFVNEEDVSFSDLEDDDLGPPQVSKFVTAEVKDSSSEDQLNTSSYR